MNMKGRSLWALGLMLVGVALAVGIWIWSGRNRDGSRTSTVTLVLDWRPGSEHAFLDLAKRRGMFAASGINLQVVPGEGSSRAANQVDAGAADFGLAAGETALLAYGSGKRL